MCYTAQILFLYDGLSIVKMAIYTQSCEQKWLKTINRGGWNKDVLGEKKIEKLTIRGGGGGGGREDDYSGLESSCNVKNKNGS